MASLQKPPHSGRAGAARVVPPGLREKVERILLDAYAPACIAVDSGHSILYSSGSVAEYFDVQPVALFANLLDLAPRDLGGPLRGLLARIADEPGGAVRQTVFIGEPGARRSIDLVVRAITADGRGAGSYLVIIEDREAQARTAALDSAPAASGMPQNAEPDSATVTSRAEAEAKAGRILVIEDHHDAAEGMRLLLELKGYNVTVAHDGLAGIEKARQFRPGIVLCDIGLPGAMDGYGVAREFRNDPELRATALVALTGYGQEKDQVRAVEAGFDAHMTKPADPAALIRLIETLPRRT